ncbi:hypothetical protein [uncultured Sphingomonas sp.]|uniref:hypothetical protein n=1 Tax=uncultured Sphingomonas sp. TaxID=158754 RepID=UPI0025EFE174|nr:hypothetical protein [uncultured Sphingomonas sp.]
MDLNYLFHRQQVSLMMAAAASGIEARRAHGALARGYAARIARVQASGGVSFPLRGL